jgi:uncharacterized protein YndB with AHSA1/START domain
MNALIYTFAFLGLITAAYLIIASRIRRRLTDRWQQQDQMSRWWAGECFRINCEFDLAAADQDLTRMIELKGQHLHAALRYNRESDAAHRLLVELRG